MNESLIATRASTQASRPSACPGLVRIVPARDGGLCRVRLAWGELSAAQARVIAEVSQAFGSGVIDVTNRANLQICGVQEDSQGGIDLASGRRGARTDSPGSDDLRNVMLSPLAGLDPHAVLDIMPLASVLRDRLQSDARLHQLSPKFALMVDGGERLSMLDHPHDVWISAVSAQRFAFGLAGCPPKFERDAPALAVLEIAHIPVLVDALLHTVLDLALPSQTRMRDLFPAAHRCRRYRCRPRKTL